MATKPPSPPSTPPCPSPLTSSPTNDLTFRPDLLVSSPATPQHFPVTLGKTVEIRLTDDKKGLGVFALRDIEPGSVVLFEEPLLEVSRGVSAPDVADLPSPDPLDGLVDGLSLEKREIWNGLCGYKREEGESDNRARLWSNGYSIKEDRETGVFATASRVNHCCVPNCWFEWRELPLTHQNRHTTDEDGDMGVNGDGGVKGRGGLLIWNSWKILEGEEITVDYGHKNKGRKEWYGFACCCGGCTDEEGERESDGDGEREGMGGEGSDEAGMVIDHGEEDG